MATIDNYMVDKITIADETGKTAFGESTLGTQYIIKGRVEEINELVVDRDGNEHRASHMIATKSEMTYTQRVWIPGDDITDTTDAKRPIKIKRARRRDGTVGHYEVYL